MLDAEVHVGIRLRHEILSDIDSRGDLLDNPCKQNEKRQSLHADRVSDVCKYFFSMRVISARNKIVLVVVEH